MAEVLIQMKASRPVRAPGEDFTWTEGVEALYERLRSEVAATEGVRVRQSDEVPNAWIELHLDPGRPDGGRWESVLTSGAAEFAVGCYSGARTVAWSDGERAPVSKTLDDDSTVAELAIFLRSLSRLGRVAPLDLRIAALLDRLGQVVADRDELVEALERVTGDLETAERRVSMLEAECRKLRSAQTEKSPVIRRVLAWSAATVVAAFLTPVAAHVVEEAWPAEERASFESVVEDALALQEACKGLADP